MDDTDLDLLLAASRPEVAHAAACEHCRAALARRSGRRWPRRLALAGASGVAVVAVGAGAAATVGLPFGDHTAPREHTQNVSTGDQCRSTFTVGSAGRAPESVAAAQQFLSTLDLDSLDLTDELAYLVEEYEHVEWDGPGPRPDYVYSFDSQDSLEQQALTKAVFDAVLAHLRSLGLPTTAVTMETESQCDDHDQVQRR